jgi:putative NIF3 family GTP cyclohydrolase 1 type 2
MELAEPASLDALVERIKAHVGRTSLRVARADRHANGAPVRTASVCAGAGGGLLAGALGTDLFVTGELRHHDALRALAHGTSVVLCEHSSSERGFLRVFAVRLREAARGALDIVVSEADREPFEIV